MPVIDLNEHPETPEALTLLLSQEPEYARMFHGAMMEKDDQIAFLQDNLRAANRSQKLLHEKVCELSKENKALKTENESLTIALQKMTDQAEADAARQCTNTRFSSNKGKPTC